jgi:hypothetical protein
MAAVIAAPIRPVGRKLVALILANAAHDNGTGVYPGEERLVRETGLSASQIRRHLHDLREEDRIIVEVRKARAGIAHEHRFDLPRLVRLDDRHEARMDAHQSLGRGAHGRAERRASVREEARISARPNVLNRPQPSGTTDARSRRARASASYPPIFEEFWSAYAYKVGKVRALRAWTKAIDEGAKPEAIIAGAHRYVAWIEAQPDPPHRKYPEGWLSGRRWEDELPDTTEGREWISRALRAVENPRLEGSP